MVGRAVCGLPIGGAEVRWLSLPPCLLALSVVRACVMGVVVTYLGRCDAALRYAASLFFLFSFSVGLICSVRDPISRFFLYAMRTLDALEARTGFALRSLARMGETYLHA